MTTSADVASHAGLSRSTVSQILNGREHLFSADTIARVRASAAELGYRPSLAGRTLARGTSDIVITLLSNVTFNPRLRELVDTITASPASVSRIRSSHQGARSRETAPKARSAKTAEAPSTATPASAWS